MILEEKLNIKEAMKNLGYTNEVISEAFEYANDLRAAGYNEETVEALYESYLEEGTVIEGEFTLEKLMMAVDPDQAFTEFWEEANA